MTTATNEREATVGQAKPGSKERNMELATQRQIEMLKNGITNSDLVERWDCSKSMVSGLIHGRFRSRQKELDFAELVGRPWSELFTQAEVRNRAELPEPDEAEPTG